MIVTIIIIIIINVFIILKICMENVPYKIKVEKCGKRAIVVTIYTRANYLPLLSFGGTYSNGYKTNQNVKCCR